MGIDGSTKNLKKIHRTFQMQRRFFKMEIEIKQFTLRKKVSFKNCSLKGFWGTNNYYFVAPL